MTNAEKFKEVFGVEPDKESMTIECPRNVMTCGYYSATFGCKCTEWWQEEYKERRK